MIWKVCKEESTYNNLGDQEVLEFMNSPVVVRGLKG